MKTLFRILWKRLRTKNPKVANAVAILAGVLIAVFFGADQMYELCDLSAWLCDNQELIYSILLIIVGAAQIPNKKKA